MRVLISGTGRGGTNLLTELSRKITTISFTDEVEDRNLFLHANLPADYGTKLTVDHPTFTLQRALTHLEKYEDLHILFAVRHPIDNCLSKILRGRPASQGGDKVTENISADATLPASIQAIRDLYEYIEVLQTEYPQRVCVVRMEDVIQETQKIVDELGEFLNIEPLPFEGFQSTNRNQYQKSRYGDALIPQTSLYKDLKNNFGGFYHDVPHVVPILESELVEEIKVYYGN